MIYGRMSIKMSNFFKVCSIKSVYRIFLLQVWQGNKLATFGTNATYR